MQLAIARRTYQEQEEEDDDLSDAEIEERKRADTVIAQYFANNMFLDEIEVPDLPFSFFKRICFDSLFFRI